ncbi:MAG: hypothetical protein ACYCVZ_10615 [Streptosporangiaceae bacterium]
MRTDRDSTDLVQQLANELADCRQRGIERLDLRTHNQVPVNVPGLERLAREYAVRRQLPATGRGGQIKRLIWDALTAMRGHNGVDAELVRDLFFGAGGAGPGSGPSADGGLQIPTVTQSAGELLDQAQARSGLTDSRFRERRSVAAASFAAFVVQFCAAADQADVVPPVPPSVPAGGTAGGTASVGTAGGTAGVGTAGVGTASVGTAGGGTASADLVAVPAAALPESAVYAADGWPGPGEPGPGEAWPGEAAHPLRTGHVDDGERFTQLLSEAVNVTIVGFTNENLTAMLASALARKRAALNDPDAFWGSLRIVFFSNKLLDSITDERPEYPDRREAFRQRRLAAIHGRRSVTVFLRRIRPTRWTVYESPFVPPFIGTLFELSTGRRLVHLMIRHPQRSAADHLYLEVDETGDQYFSSVFEAVVHSSVNDSKVVAVGLPRGDAFQPTGTRYRYNVLRDGSGAVGWLPYVLVVTWRKRPSGAEPLLQLRTEVNAARALDRLTHLATHVFLDDPGDPNGGQDAALRSAFTLDGEAPRRAARRRLYMEAGEDLPSDLVPVATDRYLHHDKEHLFFLVYSRAVPGDFQFPRRAGMYPVPLQELLGILENQALRKAALLFGAPSMPRRFHAAAVEIAALNLTLHGHAELAAELTRTAGQPRDLGDDLAARVHAEIERTRQPWFSGGQEIEIQGLSGLHYRAFFTLLLPLYARLGVPGAAEYQAEVDADQERLAAIARLTEIYHDEELMSAIPLEL